MRLETINKEHYGNHTIWQFALFDDYDVNIIATVNVEEAKDFVEIKYINVSRDFRGFGIGSKLLMKITDLFKHKTIRVETFTEREKWYSRFGFRKISQNNNIIKLIKPPTKQRKYS